MQHGDIFADFQLRSPGAHPPSCEIYGEVTVCAEDLSPKPHIPSQETWKWDPHQDCWIYHPSERQVLPQLQAEYCSPRLDLSFWYELQSYRALLSAIFQIVDSESVKIRLWYLCPEMIVLGLFDDGLSEWEKERMASELRQTPRPDVFKQKSQDSHTFNP